MLLAEASKEQRRYKEDKIVYDVPHSREKVTVWIGLVGNGVILGPHFYNGNVNGLNYLDMSRSCIGYLDGWRTGVSGELGGSRMGPQLIDVLSFVIASVTYSTIGLLVLVTHKNGQLDHQTLLPWIFFSGDT